MNIAFITFEYPPFIIGGAGRYAEKICIELAKQNNIVVVLTPNVENMKDKETLNNVEIRRIKINRKLPFAALQFWLKVPNEIKRIEQEMKIDVLHFNGISYWFLKKRISKCPQVVTVHHLVKDAIKSTNLNLISRAKDISGENSLLIPFIENRCINAVDKIIAVSNYTKNQIIDHYKISSSKIEVIHNGIDLTKRNFLKEELEETKNDFGLKDKPIVLFVGRIDDPRKGLDTLVESFKLVLTNIDASLLIVGKGDRAGINYIVDSLNISESVVFTGFIDELTLKKCYAICDVYVVPSKLEGFGLTILEAMNAKKPIIATNVGGIPEIFMDCKNGILVEPENVVDMSNAICNILSNKNLATEFGITNYTYLTDNFSWEKSAEKNKSVYRELVNTR